MLLFTFLIENKNHFQNVNNKHKSIFNYHLKLHKLRTESSRWYKPRCLFFLKQTKYFWIQWVQCLQKKQHSLLVTKFWALLSGVTISVTANSLQGPSVALLKSLNKREKEEEMVDKSELSETFICINITSEMAPCDRKEQEVLFIQRVSGKSQQNGPISRTIRHLESELYW